MKSGSPVHLSIPLPGYVLDAELDYDALGAKVDPVIAEALGDGDYVVRGISSADHAGMTRDDLVSLILETGTDKYDPNRPEVAHEDFAGYDHDFHGGRFRVKGGRLDPGETRGSSTMFGDLAYHFLEFAPLDRGHPVRIDLLLVYRPELLRPASHVVPGAPEQRESLVRNLFTFLDPRRKRAALVCVVSLPDR